MSTDDLTRRARERARSLAQGSPRNPEGWPTTSALVSELADEVDRLRATEGICTHQNAQYLAMKADRDEARAALGRVRAWIDGSDKEIPANNDWGWGYEAAVDTARAALEGEPS